jgi:NAD(P)-dependent dehydrogenase (short-subunit alcohol dehydrogenase family)
MTPDEQTHDDPMKSKTVVITGGSGVLCRAMAKRLARRGAKIALLGRTESKLKNVAEEIQAEGGIVITAPVDVLDKSALIDAHKMINSALGPCDILINGAGGNHPKATTDVVEFNKEQSTENGFFELDADTVSEVFDLNFMGTFLPSQIFGKDMIGRDGCSIINISSMSAYKPLTKVMAYSAAKAAVSNFTEWMAVHFAKSGIRVNAIAPGFFLTDQNRRLLTNEDGSLTERGNTILSHTPVGRFGNPDDLLSTLEWLCDDKSSFVTGIVVPVDGGFNAYSGV